MAFELVVSFVTHDLYEYIQFTALPPLILLFNCYRRQCWFWFFPCENMWLMAYLKKKREEHSEDDSEIWYIKL